MVKQPAELRLPIPFFDDGVSVCLGRAAALASRLAIIGETPGPHAEELESMSTRLEQIGFHRGVRLDAHRERGSAEKVSVQFRRGASRLVEERFRGVSPPIMDVLRGFEEIADSEHRRFRALGIDPGPVTLRVITYYPGSHPGIDWHTDPCWMIRLHLPEGDDALRLRSPAGDVLEVLPGVVPRVVVLYGDAAGRESGMDVEATAHRVEPLERPRTVMSAFAWTKDDFLGPAGP